MAFYIQYSIRDTRYQIQDSSKNMFRLPRRPKCSFCGCLAILIIIGLVFVVYSFFKYVGVKMSAGDIVNYLKSRAKIKIEKEVKDEIKKEGKNLEGKIYRKATEYNPEGDVLPDEVDDKLKEKVKEELR